ncbi:MAG: c-type cytochrome [Acidobacteria bacterium]|nr:c-type cytochrome [Acidobacteriota bacterium]MCB9397465.1 c-type cytochrome [Acidobacteriota bacterium]
MSDQLNETKHTFDGIEEHDNPLPGWWLGIFYVTIALAVFYVPYYHFMHPEKLPAAAWEAENKAIAEKRQAEAEMAPAGPSLAEKYEAGGWQESAKADFITFCSPCHAADGGGGIGPNFTDDYYIHGGTFENLVNVINEGVPEKGMISWKTSLKPTQIENLAFYVHSLRGTTPATAKEPQGQKVNQNGEFIAEETP